MPASDTAIATFLRSVGLDRTELAYAQAHIERGPSPVITTAAQRWSYAASLPLGVDPAEGPGLAILVRLRVVEGRVGVGVLAADQRSFVVEKEVAAKHGMGSCFLLRLPSAPVVGPLIVRNASENRPSKAVLEQVAICRLPPSAVGREGGVDSSEPTQEELPELIRSLEYLRPLVPYPGWQFDSDWNNSDYSFQTRRRLWEYCRSKRWNPIVDLPWYGDQRAELLLLSDAARQLFVAGCIDPNEFALLDAILKPGMVFVDVGAYLGLYTMFAAHRAAAVWAFEPSSREFAFLQRNVQRNNLGNAHTLQLALGNTNKTAELHVASSMHSGQNTLCTFSHQGVIAERVETVEVVRLDRFVEERKLDRIDVLKVDVEQSELEVLQGAGQLLRSLQPWLLIEVTQAPQQAPDSRLELFELLRGFDYTFYAVDRNSGLLVETGDYGADNLVASPARRPLPPEAMSAGRYYFESKGERPAAATDN